MCPQDYLYSTSHAVGKAVKIFIKDAILFRLYSSPQVLINLVVEVLICEQIVYLFILQKFTRIEIHGLAASTQADPGWRAVKDSSDDLNRPWRLQQIKKVAAGGGANDPPPDPPVGVYNSINSWQVQ